MGAVELGIIKAYNKVIQQIKHINHEVFIRKLKVMGVYGYI